MTLRSRIDQSRTLGTILATIQRNTRENPMPPTHSSKLQATGIPTRLALAAALGMGMFTTMAHAAYPITVKMLD